jgi:hypothetical protein
VCGFFRPIFIFGSNPLLKVIAELHDAHMLNLGLFMQFQNAVQTVPSFIDFIFRTSELSIQNQVLSIADIPVARARLYSIA